MSKASKTRASDKRSKEKRNRKLQQQALYEGFKARGINSIKKGTRNSAGTVLRTKRHSVGNCGNYGCERDFPELARPRLNDSNDPRVRFRTHAQQKKDGLF
jgi:hypothetical protein